MPLQNRADPFGALHATPARCMLMGNRGGRFHTGDKTLQKRRYVSRRWICCICDFKNRQRQVWGNGYTEIFFLDDVTALAAGHRPCFECRRAEAMAYAKPLPDADGAAPRADAIDLQLHSERQAIQNGARILAPADSLPDGAMFKMDGKAYAIRNGMQLQWDFSGYSYAQPLSGKQVEVLTPALSCMALQRGFVPRWHESALR